jgi:hypothetical protein
MIASKRRPASTQAVSRKVEGIEPRNQAHQEGRRRQEGGRQDEHNRKGEDVRASSGSETMACVTSRLHGNPGSPAAAFHGSRVESMPNNRTKGERQNQRQGVGSSNSTREGG